MYYYQAKVTYTREVEGGKIKNVKEQYLLYDLNYGAAEKHATEYVESYRGDALPDVELKRISLADVLVNYNINADKWYKVKVEFIALDESGTKEIKTAQLYMVQASESKEAIALINQKLSDSASDFSVHTTIETKIIDYHDFVSPHCD